MAGPFDYTIQQPDIGGSIAGGIKSGLQIGAAIDQRQSADEAKERAAAYSADLQNYLQNPTARGASAMIAKYPESQKALASSFDIYDKGQKEDIFKSGTQAYSAILNGKPEIAIGILDQRIQAAANSGEDTSDLESLKQSIQQNPQGAAAGLALTMSSMNPDAWSKIASEQREAELAPSQLSESQAKAQKAGVDAKFAESKAVQDLAKGGWEINKLQNDIGIARQNAQIAAMNAATARLDSGTKSETNRLKADELRLKLAEKVAARDTAVQQKAAEVSSARDSIDNFLNTADRVLQSDKDAINSATGPFDQFTPTILPGTADFEELVKTLGSQTFMSQIPSIKGTGSLSEKEGDKLQASLQNLSLRQSPERLMENVTEAKRLLLKARANLTTKYGVPDITPDTPASAPSPSNIDALLQKYGGAQ